MKLTTEQIKNWRQVFFALIGPYALLMPAEEIEAYRDKLQGEIEKMGESE